MRNRRCAPRPVVVTVTGLVVLVGAAAAGCGGGSDDVAASDGTPRVVTVSAAASLTDAFTELADGLMAEDPSIEVQLNFGSSGQLAAQIEQGAPADVVAFADEETMSHLEDASLVHEPEVFALNDLALVTPPGNPREVSGLGSLAELAENGGIVALCAEDAPCGRFAQEALRGADVSLPAQQVTRATNARSTLTAVSQGDADAAIVYSSDALSAGDSVDVVAIPPAANIEARYPIAVTASAGSDTAAAAFVEHVLSDRGRDVLERSGFGLP